MILPVAALSPSSDFVGACYLAFSLFIFGIRQGTTRRPRAAAT